MTVLTIDDRGIVRQDGQTAEEWLAAMFEFELCAECGWDADRHTVCVGPLGLFFARCDDPIPEHISDDEAKKLLACRLAAYR